MVRTNVQRGSKIVGHQYYFIKKGNETDDIFYTISVACKDDDRTVPPHRPFDELFVPTLTSL
jgi:hypothetical protein